MSHKASVAVLLLLLCVGQLYAAQPSVTLDSSVIYGFSTQVDKITVDKYLGIPYGQPPTDDLRFKKPEPATLDAVVNATSYGNKCPGFYELPEMDEDCLFLDVYVPQRYEGKLLPVMMFIHGGMFTYGYNAEYNGDTLSAEGNVIVVIPNYRLGALGFLSTGDNSSIGNFGLWDQRLALKWIRDNIKQFGGDINSITLIGESAGAASISHHMTSPHTKNLFHKAILQSGCRLCSWGYNATYAAIDKANELARLTGCSPATEGNTASTANLVKCLRQKTVEELRKGFLTFWSPVIDGDLILPYDPEEKFDGFVMAGVNNREGAYGVAVRKIFGPLNNRTYYHKTVLRNVVKSLYYELATAAHPSDMETIATYVDYMYKVYGLSNDSYVPDEELEAVFTDTDFLVCNKQLLDDEPASKNTFLYYFDHYINTPDGLKGMRHGWDLEFTFGLNGGLTDSYFEDYNITEEDHFLARNVRSFLTNFAKTGNPYTPKHLPNSWPSWRPYRKYQESYLSLKSYPQTCYKLMKNRMQFWLKTVPSLLQSKGPVDFNKERFDGCNIIAASASFVDVTKTVVVTCFFVLSILY